ncbi:MAG: oxidoreductase [Mycobacterium sp.]|jgi:hypothetical protein|nr:oxidoreductase [Mycobacterium sp.]
MHCRLLAAGSPVCSCQEAMNWARRPSRVADYVFSPVRAPTWRGPQLASAVVVLQTGTVPEDTDCRVCLLERGDAYPPGSFPRTPDGMAKNFWDPSEGLYGMFNVWSFEHVDAIVSSGLGGRRPQHYVGPRRNGKAAPYVRPSVRNICGLARTVVDSAARSGRPSFMHAL